MPLTGRVGRHTGQGGRHAQNWPDDQMTVISLLNNISLADGAPAVSLSTSVRSGICSDELYRAISSFEDKYIPRQRSGYVDPGGAMLKRMEELAAKKTAAARAIRFVTPEQYLGPPSAKTKDISSKEIPITSNDPLWVGLAGDSQNVVKTVGVNIPGAVTISEANAENNIRWFRLSKPQGSKAQVQAKDGNGKLVVSFDLSIIELPKGSSGPIDFEFGPDGIPVHTPPQNRADYIDTRMTAIGYSIYLGGCQIYCTGMASPIFVSDDFLKLDIEQASAINSTIFDTFEKANSAIQQGPPMAKGVTPYAFYQGAGGAVIAPTIFSPATTPRIIATYFEARRLLAEYVQNALGGVAIAIVGGRILNMILPRIFRAPKDPKPPPRNLPPPLPPKIHPVNKTVNVGGGGEVPNVTNLNPIKPHTGGPTSGIPNHVPQGMEKMDSVFQPGSVDKMISNRLRYGDINWTQGAQAAANVMPRGGKVSMNIWTQSPAEVNALKAAFQKAGFKDVQVIGQPGPGTMLVGVR